MKMSNKAMKNSRLEIRGVYGRWSWVALLLWALSVVVEQLGSYFGAPSAAQGWFARLLSEAVYDPGFFGLIHVMGGVGYVFLLYLLYEGLCGARSLLRFVVALLGVLSVVSTVVMVIPSGQSVYEAVREVSWWSGFRATFLANDNVLEGVLNAVTGVWLTVAWRGRMRWCGVSWWLCPVLSGLSTALAMRAMLGMSGHEALRVGEAWRVLSVLLELLPLWCLRMAMTTYVSAVKVSGDDDVRM